MNGLLGIHHVQITVPVNLEPKCLAFYRGLGLLEIDKPESLKKNGGAWFKVGDQELHVSPEPDRSPKSKRHVCFLVANLDQAREQLIGAGISVEEDLQPIESWRRCYAQDPAGNRLEFAQEASTRPFS